MKPAPDPSAASARSPFAGCAIFIAAICVMVFLVGFSIVTLFRQFNEIAKFTGEKPAPVSILSPEGKERELNDLAQRVEAFRQQLSGKTEAKLALSVDDLNLAIAAYDSFKELRGTFHVLSAEGDQLRIAISFPLNGKPRLTHQDEPGIIASDMRYLNGTLIARPVLLKREIVLKLSDISVPGAQVPREFIEQMSPYRMMECYLTDPAIAPVMAEITRVGVEDGKVVLARIPGEHPADAISNEQVNSASSRFFTILGALACLFLLFAGVVVFTGMRAKAKKS